MSGNSSREDKVNLLRAAIKEIGVPGARWVEENVDEQYRALTYLWEYLGDPETFLKLAVMNASVSYQLTGTGESWWWEFAHFFSERTFSDILAGFTTLLRGSRHNRRLIPQKIRRLKILWQHLKDAQLLSYYPSMEDLWKNIAQWLGARLASKTVVFAVKMYGYAARIATATFRPYPSSVPIPADSRIERLTQCLSDIKATVFWARIGEDTGVPPLHIDSLLWPLLGKRELAALYAERFGTAGEVLSSIVGTCRGRR